MSSQGDLRQLLLAAANEAIATLSGRTLVARALSGSHPHTRAIHLLALGKAACAMARGSVDALGDRIASGIIVTKDGHLTHDLPDTLVVKVAGHPYADERSLDAGETLLDFVAMRSEDELLLVALSGGASALAVAPAWGLPLFAKAAAVRAVAEGGASIHELNVVRKHLSRLKGGRLGVATRAQVLALVISDVIDNDLSTIGGGPVSPDPSTFGDAFRVVDETRAEIPESVRAALLSRARADETPKPGDSRLARVSAQLLAGPDELVTASVAALAAHGFAIAEAERGVTMSVEKLSDHLAEKARELARRTSGPIAFVAGGEPVLRVARAGHGGRAQHTALGVAIRLARQRLPAGLEVAVLAMGSDGTDGPTSAAGGLVDGDTCARAIAGGVDPERAHGEFDSGLALAAAEDLVVTGPTGTNLCDLFVVAVRAAGARAPKK